MTGFKFTDDLQSALRLIGGMVRNLLLFGGSRSGKTGGAYGREVYGILGKMGERLPGTAQYPGIPSLPELPDYENRVVRNKPPKYRSRTVVRLVMPAAWAGPGSVSKMGLVQRRPCRTVLHRKCPECPKCLRRRIPVVRNNPPKYRSRTVVRLVMPAAWAGPGSVSKMGLVQRRPCRAVLSKMRVSCVQMSKSIKFIWYGLRKRVGRCPDRYGKKRI